MLHGRSRQLVSGSSVVLAALFNGENPSGHTTSRSTLPVSSTTSLFAPPVKLSCFLGFFPSSCNGPQVCTTNLYFSHTWPISCYVLIFFQMTKAMDIIEGFLKIMGWKYLCLDGASGTKTEECTVAMYSFSTRRTSRSRSSSFPPGLVASV